MTDRHLKPGFGGVPTDEEKEFSRVALIRAEGETVIRVYPLRKVSLGQALVLVADGTIFCLEAVWTDMGEEDKDRFRHPAARGAGWMDREPEAQQIPRILRKGGRWCVHKGFSKEVKEAVKDPQVMAFGVMRPSQQSAGKIVVGVNPHTPEYYGTCGGVTETSRQCSPEGSEFGAEELETNKGELDRNAEAIQRQLREESEEGGARMMRNADRQLREESLSGETEQEEWMRMRGRTIADLHSRTTAIEEGWKGYTRARKKSGQSRRRLGQEAGSARAGRQGLHD